jgi:hypothetical protein
VTLNVDTVGLPAAEAEVGELNMTMPSVTETATKAITAHQAETTRSGRPPVLPIMVPPSFRRPKASSNLPGREVRKQNF